MWDFPCEKKLTVSLVKIVLEVIDMERLEISSAFSSSCRCLDFGILDFEFGLSGLTNSTFNPLAVKSMRSLCLFVCFFFFFFFFKVRDKWEKNITNLFYFC